MSDSFRYSQSVSHALAERLPVTLKLTLAALIFAVLVGLPLGVISAYRRNSALDVRTMTTAVAFVRQRLTVDPDPPSNAQPCAA